MLHQTFLHHLQDRFTDFFKSATTIQQHIAVPGGDINQAFKLETSKGLFLVKINAALFGLDFFEKEARGLMHLADVGALKIPRPLFDGKYHQQVFLVMEYIEPGEPAADFWTDFGASLARLHQHTQPEFGLGYDNYIGRLVQQNTSHPTWTAFYGMQRIWYMAEKAATRQLLNQQEMQRVETLLTKLPQLLPDEKPHLLHGDLWRGNFIVAANGKSAVFDPAIYHGNREMDLAMTQLFGGFDPAFYDAYQHHYPLQNGWQNRVDLCQLYPLLVHLVLFGGSYYNNVVDILKRYT